MSIGNHITATRVGVGIKKLKDLLVTHKFGHTRIVGTGGLWVRQIVLKNVIYL